MHRRMLFVASLLALLPTTVARAVEFRHREPPFVPVHHRTCRFHGENVELGQHRCLDTAEGPRSAECVMEQNVTSWRPSHDPCPQAALFTPRG